MKLNKELPSFPWLDLLEYIFDLGHGGDVPRENLHRFDKESQEAKTIVGNYQRFFKEELAEDQKFGDFTETHLLRPRCSCPDILPALAAGARRKWGEDCKHNITYNFNLPGRGELTTKGIERTFHEQMRRIESVCDIRFVYRPDISDVLITADWGRMSPKTLAWSFLTEGCGSRIVQEYNRAQQWSLPYLGATILHEVGHGNGQSHSRSREDIMFPSINERTELGRGDIREYVAQYGEPKEKPTEPPAPGFEQIILRVSGKDLTVSVENLGGDGKPPHDFT